MTFSMHPAGYNFTFVDFMMWGAIRGSPQASADVLSGKYAELERWYKEFMEKQDFILQVNEVMRDLNAVFTYINFTDLEIQSQETACSI